MTISVRLKRENSSPKEMAQAARCASMIEAWGLPVRHPILRRLDQPHRSNRLYHGLPRSFFESSFRNCQNGVPDFS